MEIPSLSESEESVHVQAPPLKRPRRIQTVGSWFLALVVIAAGGGIALQPPLSAFDIEVVKSLATRSVIGVICTRWEYVEDLAESYSWLKKGAARKSREARTIHGYSILLLILPNWLIMFLFGLSFKLWMISNGYLAWNTINPQTRIWKHALFKQLRISGWYLTP